MSREMFVEHMNTVKKLYKKYIEFDACAAKIGIHFEDDLFCEMLEVTISLLRAEFPGMQAVVDCFVFDGKPEHYDGISDVDGVKAIATAEELYDYLMLNR